MLSAAHPVPWRGARRWRAPVSLGLGLPLLLGSSPAAAAGAGSVLLGGVTTGIGVLATLWALLGPPRGANAPGAAAMTAFAALLGASAWWLWRHQRGRVRGHGMGSARRRRAAGRTLVQTASPGAVPVGLDAAEVLAAARTRFLHLQAAWDAADIPALRNLTTPDMLEELLHMLPARGADAGRTDVVSLHAELLGLEEFGAAYLASVEFSGFIRESVEQGTVPFRELWMLAGTKDESPSWRLARQQALF